MRGSRYILIIALLIGINAQAEVWRTHFAYNNVTQIAMAPEKVYAISDGSLYSVDKQTEQMRIYNTGTGLHATGITCIHYDAVGQQLLIAYDFGKIDLLSERGVKYIGELYDKDMTQRKTIYNVTIQGRTAYLSTHYGIQTMDLRENKLVDSYWLRPGGQETPVKDVLVTHDSIYAFTDDLLYCASLSDPLSDYHYWHAEALGRVARDEDKGVHYQDATSHWYAAQAEGIVRFTQTERLAYKPNGPLVNNPYRLNCYQGQLFMVPGGRWSKQNGTPGCVMRYDGQQWTNISAETIQAQIQAFPLDFMNVAVDPRDKHHYFVTSYGTGLYEFRNDVAVRHEIASNTNTLVSIAPNDPANYTRLDFAVYDDRNNLWMLDACTYGQLQALAADGTWHALTIEANNQNLELHTPGGLVIDRFRPNHKWIATARYNTFVSVIDDHDSPFDSSDDRVIVRTEWTNQLGEIFHPENIYAMVQDRAGRIWIGTEQGVVYIEPTTDCFASNAVVQPDFLDENGEKILATQLVQAISQDKDGRIWLGTKNRGVVVLNEAATEIVAQYTTDNTSMPADGILSLAYDSLNDRMYVGTGNGLVEYDPNGHGEGLEEKDDEGAIKEDPGSMLQWKLHYSYANPQEVAATPKAVFAMADGNLFSVDRSTETITCWNKATGLNGSSVAHIAYDAVSGQIVIAYENGQIDLLDPQGNVTQMPDIVMKAGFIDMAIHDVRAGSRLTYLAMSFGIVAVNTKKAEVTDTYYIGHDASAVEVQQVVEMGDSIFAFSYDSMYRAALRDNLVDYTFWTSEALPCAQVQRAASHKDALYIQYDDALYRREGSGWTKVVESLVWFHASDGHLLVYREGQGLFEYQDDGTLTGLTNQYTPNDGVYTNGQYWLGVPSKGLVRLGMEGDDFFVPEGPLSNFGYKIQVAHGQVYVAPGGRWATEFARQGSLSIYDGQSWRGVPWPDTWYYTNHNIRDAVSFGIDPTDAGHFFVATYGTGVFEFKDYRAVAHYDSINSTLRRANKTVDNYYFTRTDGAYMDEQGNLWVLNATSIGSPLHVRTPLGQWLPIKLYSGGVSIEFTTPGGIFPDQRNSRYKWIYDQRSTQCLILYDDGGTPTVTYDDYCVKRDQWIDQNGNVITPANIMCVAQDADNRLWVGTDKGIILIPSDVDFFTSNACRRIIIPRNDGTGLGDYLLGNEMINCIVPDGGNRMWIGTTSSGLYLIEDDTITVAHFTAENSLLPSNTIQTIAIHPTTGEVFVGTANGIASYRSDASEPQETMDNAYAFPNPVRPDYSGVISIAGLMDDTEVRIVDSGGNLVCKTRSHGGMAVWDGKDAYGRRATPGVYSALCNAVGGHTVVKILVIR